MIFNIICKLGKKIKFAEERYNHIISRHMEIAGKEKEIEESLTNPDFVQESKYDSKVLLYYKKLDNLYFVTVVKMLNSKGFILTAYIANIIKRGKIIWQIYFFFMIRKVIY